ncbi:MAG: hypothetical protein ACLQGP_37925 [Isosphaeraceae bacterium]
MMSNIPLFETMSVANGSNPIVQVAPMEQTVVQGNLSYGRQTDEVRVSLQQGEVFTANLDVYYPALGGLNIGSTLTAYGPNGGQVATQSTDIDNPPVNNPITGAATYDDSVAFTAPSTGTYTLQAAENPELAEYIGTGNYTLTLRPIALDDSTLNPEVNAQDAAKLQYSGGGLYAYLGPNDQSLTFAGPTGRGFTVQGHFSELTNQEPGSSFTTSTITSTGPLTIESAQGNFSMSIPTGVQISVSTIPNGYGGRFGEVAPGAASITFPGEDLTNDLLSPFAAFLSTQSASAVTDLQDAGLPGLSSITLGIGLGGTVDGQVADAPVNAAVPYLYLSGNNSYSNGLGTAKIDVGYTAGVVIDPADPSLFVDVTGLPVVPEFALGISANGYIPFTPAVVPSHFEGDVLYGDFYTSATLSLADLSGDLLPFSFSADVLVNLNTTGVGWTSAIQSMANEIGNGDFQGAVPNPSTFAIGVNLTGSLSLGFEVGSIDVPVAGGTLIYNGPTNALDFAATTALNPFQGTSLSFLNSATPLSIDGFVNTTSGDFSFNVDTGFQLFGYQLANAELTFTNSGITYDASTSFLGLETNVFGSIDYSGNAEIAGEVDFSTYQNWTWAGSGIQFWIDTTIHFDIKDGTLQDWGSGTAWLNVWAGGNIVWCDGISFNNYDDVSVGNFSWWTIVDDALADL